MLPNRPHALPWQRIRTAFALAACELGLAFMPHAVAQSEKLFPGSGVAGYGLGLVGDLNSDGRNDVVQIGLCCTTITIQIGRPDGTFGPSQPYTVAGTPQLLADFNGDGHLDVLTFDSDIGPRVMVLPNLGDGTFGTPVESVIPSLDWLSSISAGDVDQDGDLDLAEYSPFSSDYKYVRIHSGSGDGSFAASFTQINVGGFPGHVELSDVNGDGLVDLLARVNPVTGSAQLVVALGFGNGSFGSASKTGLSTSATGMASHDFDADGLLDAVVATYSFEIAASARVFRGTGSFFTQVNSIDLWNEPLQLEVPYGRPSVGDVDEDGVADISVATAQVGSFPGVVFILMGLGGFGFAAPTVTDMDTYESYPAMSDIDGDSHLDLIDLSAWPGIAVAQGRGDGTFEIPDRILLYSGTAAISTADYDQDGQFDVLAVAQQPSPSLRFLHGEGDGSFMGDTASAAGFADRILTADLTGDGIPDVLDWSRTSSGGAQIQTGLGDGTFAAGSVLAAGAVADADVSDLDLDGQLDVATSDSAGGEVHLYAAVGLGAFIEKPAVATIAMPSGLLLADVDADGLPDMLTACTASAEVLLMSGLGGWAFGSPVTLTTDGGPRDVIAADLDLDGDVDLATACWWEFEPPPSANDGPGDGYGIDYSTTIHRQGPDGKFGDPEVFDGVTASNKIVASDLDRDGHVDLVSGLPEPFTSLEFIQFQLGLPAGQLASANGIRTGTDLSDFALADFDSDGFPDIAVSQSGENDVRIYLNRSPTWATLGHASSPTASVPLLTGAGDPIPDQLVTVTGSLMPPPAPGLLFVGLTAPFSPFQGGVLVPSPDVVVPVRAEFTLSERWPKGIPAGTPVYLQAWFQSLATGEISATNALVTIAQ